MIRIEIELQTTDGQTVAHRMADRGNDHDTFDQAFFQMLADMISHGPYFPRPAESVRLFVQAMEIADPEAV